MQRFLGSAESSAAFLTELGEGPKNATIKLVQCDPANAAPELARWERIADLSHPHLIRMLDAGVYQPESTGLLYVVMEYADESLAGVLRERPLEEDEVRAMLDPVLDALSYIHSSGLVHGHVKPSNIMAVGEDVKLAGDGICEVGVLPDGHSQGGPYDSPESRVEGKSQPGDVWSLGVTLVEALTQRLPAYAGPQQELVLPDNLPSAFVDVARRCLALDPQRRPSVADVAARLRGAPAAVVPAAAPAVATQIVAAAPAAVTPLPVREMSEVRRRRYDEEEDEPANRGRYLVAGIGGVLALGAILAGTGVLRHSTPPPTPVSQTTVQPAAPDPARPVEPKPSPTAAGKPLARQIPSAAPQQSRDRVVEPARSTERGGSRVLQEVLPEIPRNAQDTIHGTVRVNVRAEVDSNGRVVSARLDMPSSSKYLANLTIDAARKWVFSPVRSEWILRFDLTRGGIKVRTTELR